MEKSSIMSLPSEVKASCPNCFPQHGYCPDCGAKKFDRSEFSLKKFFGGLFQEVSDFDSKLLRTLYVLSFKPGFLSLEHSRGISAPYIKPIRLFITIAIVHFFAFNIFHTVDFYSIDTIRLIDRFQLLERLENISWIKGRINTNLDPLLMNKEIKNALSVLIYLAIFILAGHLKLLFLKQKKYYAEHLVFALHTISAAFFRNFLLIPVLLVNVYLGMFFVMVLNFAYVILAFRNFYQLTLLRAILSLVPTLALLLLMMLMLFVSSALIAMWV
jgi:hypothetical protein